MVHIFKHYPEYTNYTKTHLLYKRIMHRNLSFKTRHPMLSFTENYSCFTQNLICKIFMKANNGFKYNANNSVAEPLKYDNFNKTPLIISIQ